MTPGDWLKIQAAFDNPKDARLNEGAITFIEQSYKPIRCDNDSLYAKNVNSNSRTSEDQHGFMVNI